MLASFEDLIGLLQSAGPEAALAPCVEALRASPDDYRLHHLHGRILNNLSRLPEALSALDLALERQSQNAMIQSHRGHVLRQLGRREEAHDAFVAALEIDRNTIPACSGLAMLMLEQQQYREASDLFHRAAQLEPDNAMHWYNLGLTLQSAGKLQNAGQAYRRVLELNPDDADARCNLAATMQSDGNLDEAARLYREVIAQSPGHPQATAALAGIHDLKDEDDAAFALLAPWLSGSEPADNAIHLAAAQLQKKTGDSDSAIRHVDQVIERRESGWLQRSTAHFIRASISDRQGDYDTAFEHAALANKLREHEYRPEDQRAWIERLMSVFPLQREPAQDDRAPTVVFIIGMPRSGTSLVEQILDSHSQVFGAGELAVLGQFAKSIRGKPGQQQYYPYSVSGLNDEDRGRLAAELKEKYRGLAGGSAVITDKMWRNFEQLGLIQYLMPGARVIHCRRDPRDTSLSCFLQSFGASGPPFSYGLSHIGHFFGLYRQLMAYWGRTLEIPVLDVDYETLVDKPETEIARLLDFVGLSWEKECLDFHRNTRVVKTASNEQVRQPMYRTSIGRHQNYERHLGELYAALEANGVELESQVVPAPSSGGRK